ncbi:MAG: hypothetical protein ACI96W_000955 [Paraglaciecola sp.]|jgi:hypothetical protein
MNKSLITVLKHASLLRNQLKLLTKIDLIKHNIDSRLGFVLHTITGFHRPSLTHYYGLICHLTPTISLGLPLEFMPLIYTKFRCQASPVTVPVTALCLPVRNATLRHSIALTKYWASRYFVRLSPHAADKFDRNEFEQPPVGL